MSGEICRAASALHCLFHVATVCLLCCCQSDVYAFGCLALQLFTGQAPWHGQYHWDVRRQVLAGERPHIPVSVPDDVARLLELCWRHTPASRPTDGEVVEELDIIVATRRLAADVATAPTSIDITQPTPVHVVPLDFNDTHPGVFESLHDGRGTRACVWTVPDGWLQAHRDAAPAGRARGVELVGSSVLSLIQRSSVANRHALGDSVAVAAVETVWLTKSRCRAFFEKVWCDRALATVTELLGCGVCTHNEITWRGGCAGGGIVVSTRWHSRCGIAVGVPTEVATAEYVQAWDSFRAP